MELVLKIFFFKTEKLKLSLLQGTFRPEKKLYQANPYCPENFSSDIHIFYFLLGT